jgi:hypothetical protein
VRNLIIKSPFNVNLLIIGSCRRVIVVNQPPDYVFGVTELNKLNSERIAKLCDDCRERTVLKTTTEPTKLINLNFQSMQ